MKPSTHSKITEIISALFILLFVYTATSKLMSHDAFVRALKNSPVTTYASGILSWAIPVIELLVSLMLLLPSYRNTGLLSSLVLMGVFTIYIGYMLITSSHLPCSCGGVITQLSWKGHLWLNLFFTLLAATALHLERRQKFLFE